MTETQKNARKITLLFNSLSDKQLPLNKSSITQIQTHQKLEKKALEELKGD